MLLFKRSWVCVVLGVLAGMMLTACGPSTTWELCEPVKIGQPINGVIDRAGTLEFNSVWLTKYDKDPVKHKVKPVGKLQLSDITGKTEEFKKLGAPATWKHGGLMAMHSALPLMYTVCSVKFADGKVTYKDHWGRDDIPKERTPPKSRQGNE